MLKSGEVNWDAVRAMYVTTTMSLRDVANQHGLKLHTVETHSSQGGWVAARMAWRARAAAVRAAAEAVDPVLCAYILRNVTRRVRYEEMPVPCGINQFFRARRRFFAELDGRVP